MLFFCITYAFRSLRVLHTAILRPYTHQARMPPNVSKVNAVGGLPLLQLPPEFLQLFAGVLRYLPCVLGYLAGGFGFRSSLFCDTASVFCLYSPVFSSAPRPFLVFSLRLSFLPCGFRRLSLLFSGFSLLLGGIFLATVGAWHGGTNLAVTRSPPGRRCAAPAGAAVRQSHVAPRDQHVRHKREQKRYGGQFAVSHRPPLDRSLRRSCPARKGAPNDRHRAPAATRYSSIQGFKLATVCGRELRRTWGVPGVLVYGAGESAPAEGFDQLRLLADQTCDRGNNFLVYLVEIILAESRKHAKLGNNK
jgi:hypothetical protein